MLRALQRQINGKSQSGGPRNRPGLELSLLRGQGRLFCVYPVAHADANSITAHAQLLEKAKQGRIDIYFEGDSITRRNMLRILSAALTSSQRYAEVELKAALAHCAKRFGRPATRRFGPATGKTSL